MLSDFIIMLNGCKCWLWIWQSGLFACERWPGREFHFDSLIPVSEQLDVTWLNIILLQTWPARKVFLIKPIIEQKKENIFFIHIFPTFYSFSLWHPVKFIHAFHWHVTTAFCPPLRLNIFVILCHSGWILVKHPPSCHKHYYPSALQHCVKEFSF